MENHLISENQSGFRPGEFCINQLLPITHDIYRSVDMGLEVRGVHLDISKALDKVWNEGLIYKFIKNEIFGDLWWPRRANRK